MATRKQIDWDPIEKDVRAGVLSLREIGRKHTRPESSIRKKIKEEGWERDLTDIVRRRAQEKLLRKTVRKSNVSTEDVVEENSDVLVEVRLSHRKDINALKKLETKLIKELSGKPTKLYLAQFQGKIIQKTVSLTASERAMAANNLANVQHKSIQLERQAYNLNDKSDIADKVDSILIQFVSADDNSGTVS